MLPRQATREACHNKVEATPEKMYGTALADEARAKLLQHPIRSFYG
jgi:hypothetical protein